MGFSVVSLLCSAFFGGMRRTRADRERAHRPNVCSEGGTASGVRRYVGMGIRGHTAVQDTTDRDHLFQRSQGAVAATKFGLPWHLTVTILSGEEWKKSFMGRSGIQLVPCWLLTTWYDCVLRQPMEQGRLVRSLWTRAVALRHGWHSCDNVGKKAYSGHGRYPHRWTPTATERKTSRWTRRRNGLGL